MGPTTAATTTVTDRRTSILDAASALFAEKGSRGTSIAAVAERAGVTDAGVLYHFNTKKDLLLAVLERFDTSVERGLQDHHLTAIDLIRSTREWGAGMEEVPEIQSLLIMLSAEHLKERGPARTYIQRRYRRIVERYTRAFAEAAEAGDLRADLDPLAEASSLIAHLDGIRFQWFLLDGQISMAKSVRTYVDAALARLAPERVGR
jgi:AcrR family transcriptional regulator